MRPSLAAVLLLLGQGLVCAQTPPPNELQPANWIWFAPASMTGPGSLPASICYFRGESRLPEDRQPESAELFITADNLYTVYLNGQSVGESDTNPNAWNQPKRFRVTDLIRLGRNVLAVEAANTADGPAGLLVTLNVRYKDGRKIVWVSDSTWKGGHREEPAWQQMAFDDTQWQHAQVVGRFGDRPWGTFPVPQKSQPRQTAVGAVSRAARQAVDRADRKRPLIPVMNLEPTADFPWPEAIIYLGDDCSLYRPATHRGTSMDSLTVTIFNSRNSRSFPEHDLPSPMKIGHKLMLLKPARPGVAPRVLLDAGAGAIGSPSVSFDGKSVFFSMARAGDPFFHIYRMPENGGRPEQLTDGPFHDIDPAQLPDDRIVFTSTRIGTYEEYHNPPSRSLFVMDSDGSGIRPLTHTIIFDNEPEILSDGRIVFIRSDNFFDRGKVETLLHAIRPDGTEGYTEFGLNNSPEYGGRLRAFYCGSPAPLPDGRLAFLSDRGITIGRPGHARSELVEFRVAAGDVAALADGRLVCTLADQNARYATIAVLDPKRSAPTLTRLYSSTEGDLHSPVFLGARTRPPVLTEKVDPDSDDDEQATGFLFCQNARLTQNTTAGWSHVRAIRVLAANGLTNRSSHSYIVHAGSEVIELGTVPIAPDGSFSIEVPANTPLALQAVDGEGRSELNEMSWIYVRPGERRSCAGCHQPRHVAPPSSSPVAMALQSEPLRLVGQGSPHRFRGNNAAVTGLMELQFDRYREVAGINRHSDTADPLSTGNAEVIELMSQLRGDDQELATSAAQRLSIFRSDVAADALAECLVRSDRELRVAAAVSLATCGSRNSVPNLLDALDDPDPLVGLAAAMALENLTGYAPQFNPFAEAGLRREQTRSWRKWFAVNSWPEIERTLCERLQSDNRDTVRRAAVALGHVGGDAARSPLRRYVSLGRDANPFPKWLKGHRGDGARFNSLADVNPRTLQAVTRSIGYLNDAEAVPLLAETFRRHSDPETGNLFLAEAAAEALGRIDSKEAESALIEGFGLLKDYPRYTRWYGDHDALMACHASPIHYLIAEALDARGSERARPILTHLIRSIPIDPDRALLLGNDDYETLVGRLIRRQGAEEEVVETCLSILGDSRAERDDDIARAIATIHRCWAGQPTPEMRAAQVLSLACRDQRFAERVRATFDRYVMVSTDIRRVFDDGIPIVKRLPTKHWVCFFLARTLGSLTNPDSASHLLGVLKQSQTEADTGRPDPLGPGVHFLHNDLTPCWRAAVCWALGRTGDRRAVPALLEIVRELNNSLDTRHAAAEALGQIAEPESLEAIERLAVDYPEISTRRVLLRACRRIRDAGPSGTAYGRGR